LKDIEVSSSAKLSLDINSARLEVATVGNSKNPSSLPIEHQKANYEESSKIFDELITHLESLEDYRRQYAAENYASIDWNPILLPFIIPVTVLLFTTIIVVRLELTDLNWVVIFILQITLVFSLFSSYQLIKRFCHLIKQIKKQKPLQSEMLKKLKSSALFDQKLIYKLARFPQEKLKYVESHIKELIEEIQVREKETDSFLPILSFVFLIVPLIFITEPAKLIFVQSDFAKLISKLTGFFGIGIPVCSLLLKYLSVSATQSKILNCRKCLFLLNQAQILADSLRPNDGGKLALIAEDELSGLLETVYLLRSPENARRLLAAIERSHHRDQEPLPSLSTAEAIAQLRQELGIE
jgi:hypothetical protein